MKEIENPLSFRASRAAEEDEELKKIKMRG